MARARTRARARARTGGGAGVARARLHIIAPRGQFECLQQFSGWLSKDCDENPRMRAPWWRMKILRMH
jgi:hypothetical protein